MTGGNARHGRRDNGLYASNYAAIGDVDPRIGEHLLDVLGNRGIAAYLQPTSDQHPITRLTTLPARPTDRLYVDRSEVETAREFLEILTKETEPIAPPAPSTDFDDAWASIVAGFEQSPGTSVDQQAAPWPAVEDVPSHGASATAGPAETPREWPRWTPAARTDDDDSGSLLHGLDSFGSGLADTDDEDDDYHPPAPPPLPRFATITIVAILGIIAGVAVVLDPVLLPIDPTVAAILGGVSILAGMFSLISRMRPGRGDGSDGPDNGAVV